MITIVLVDDQDLVRMGLNTLFANEEGFEVVGEAGDGLSAVEVVRRHRPDVVFMDIRMPGIDGLEATRRIAADDTVTDVKIIVLTTFDHDQHVFEALRAGASGFLLKSASPAVLVEAARTVTEGGALLTPSVTRTLIEEFVGAPPRVVTPHPRLRDLTPRERQIMGMVARGMSNAEIADALVLSPATARTHVSRAMTKLGARDRAQLVVFGYQSGLA